MWDADYMQGRKNRMADSCIFAGKCMKTQRELTRLEGES